MRSLVLETVLEVEVALLFPFRGFSYLKEGSDRYHILVSICGTSLKNIFSYVS